MEKITSGRMLIALILAFAVFLGMEKALAQDFSDNSCILCHSKLSGPRGEPVKLLKQSIHQEVGTTCDSCHGGDPQDADLSWRAHKASPEAALKVGFIGKPSEEEIPEFCGKCHVTIKDNYLNSNHGAMGIPNCVTCHTSHSVQRTSLAKIRQEVCAMCHETPRGQVIEALIVEARHRLEQVSDLVEKYRAYLPSGVEDQLNSAQAQDATVGSVFHTFSMDNIKEQTESLKVKADTIAQEVEELKEELRNRKKIGVGILIFTLCAAAALFYYRKLLPIPHD